MVLVFSEDYRSNPRMTWIVLIIVVSNSRKRKILIARCQSRIKMRELNGSACNALYEGVEWSGPWILLTLITLAIVNVMVVLGNVLVILAVYYTSKLRNVTNMFIVSLAVADLLVGLAVLPFSATWEVFKFHRRRSNILPTWIPRKKRKGLEMG